MFILGCPTFRSGQVELNDADWTVIVPFRSSSGRRYFRNNGSTELIYIASTNPDNGGLAPTAADPATIGFPIAPGDRLEHIHKGIVFGRVAASGGTQTVSFADYIE